MQREFAVLVIALAMSWPVLASDALLPAVVHWDASTADMQVALAGKCTKMVARPVDPPFLDNTKKQMQIDCEGFDFRGKARHAEFVIGDDRLKMVWIMTATDEDAALRDAMIAEYGPPDHRNKRYDAFAAHGAALRLDKHEVLFYSRAAAGDTEPDFAPDKN